MGTSDSLSSPWTDTDEEQSDTREARGHQSFQLCKKPKQQQLQQKTPDKPPLFHQEWEKGPGEEKKNNRRMYRCGDTSPVFFSVWQSGEGWNQNA